MFSANRWPSTVTPTSRQPSTKWIESSIVSANGSTEFETIARSIRFRSGCDQWYRLGIPIAMGMKSRAKKGIVRTAASAGRHYMGSTTWTHPPSRDG